MNFPSAPEFAWGARARARELGLIPSSPLLFHVSNVRPRWALSPSPRFLNINYVSKLNLGHYSAAGTWPALPIAGCSFYLMAIKEVLLVSCTSPTALPWYAGDYKNRTGVHAASVKCHIEWAYMRQVKVRVKVGLEFWWWQRMQILRADHGNERADKTNFPLLLRMKRKLPHRQWLGWRDFLSRCKMPGGNWAAELTPAISAGSFLLRHFILSWSY